MFWYLLLFLVPAGIGAYLIWDHRRKSEERAAASAARLNMLLGATLHVPDEAAASPLKSETTPASGDPSAPSVQVPAPAAYIARERVLSAPETLLYLLLKTGLPECHVFAHVALRTVLDAAPTVTGYQRNEQTRRLSWHAVDFLVCDRAFRPFAVVELARKDEADGTAGARRSWIGTAGLRYLEFEPTALPRKEALRTQVLGEGGADTKDPVTPATS